MQFYVQGVKFNNKFLWDIDDNAQQKIHYPPTFIRRDFFGNNAESYSSTEKQQEPQSHHNTHMHD